ncbi:cyclic nucleotide-binding domain-containing protein [Haloferula sp.]|uniref:cyclic nucleotide-binding domain-containing protein n=1 Tax=Haloferula sp. TaxID=2497595 RepID=UPI0032A09D05
MTPESLPIPIGVALSIYLAVWLLGRLALRRAEKPPRLTLHLFAISFGAWAACRIFYPEEPWLGHLGAALIFCSSLFLWVLFDRIICGAWLENRRNVKLPIILRQLGGVVVVLVAVACIMKFGYHHELTGLIATSGIAAVIIGFAMQDLLSNVIAGFSIHMTGAYRVGDWLLLGDTGERAAVTEINWRSTRFINNDQVSFELPNSDIVKGRIVNLNYPTPEHGIRMTVGLDYDVPPALAKESLLAACAGAQGVLESPAPTVFLSEFADSAITYELRIWMRHARLYNTTCDEIRTSIWYELNRRNIRIPFPIRTLETRTPNEPQSLSSAREKAVEILRSASPLSCLTVEEATELVEKSKLSLYGAREALITRDQEGQSMFVLLDGHVEAVGRTEKGARVTLGRMGPGECFGERSLLTGEPRNATVRAEYDTLVLEIGKQDLSPLVESNPDLAERLGELLSQREQSRSKALTPDNSDDGSNPADQTSSPKSLADRIRSFFKHST